MRVRKENFRAITFSASRLHNTFSTSSRWKFFCFALVSSLWTHFINKLLPIFRTYSRSLSHAFSLYKESYTCLFWPFHRTRFSRCNYFHIKDPNVLISISRKILWRNVYFFILGWKKSAEWSSDNNVFIFCNVLTRSRELFPERKMILRGLWCIKKSSNWDRRWIYCLQTRFCHYVFWYQ